MHFEILVEGQSDLTTLSILMEKIVGPYRSPNTWKIHKHRGIGKIPEFPKSEPNRNDPTLLHNLPSKLRAYGKSLRQDEVVVVLVDLDDRQECSVFKQQLSNLLFDCDPKPRTLFRIAIEELEAWFLGDEKAIKAAYPNANQKILDTYQQDSQCGTWEKLADAIHQGGFDALSKERTRSRKVLQQKLTWAKMIAPQMNVEHNRSPSFKCFCNALRNLSTN
ncbi:MAG: DUF4276 family protein [Candidatus Methylumidiphilus sp.]